MSENQEEVFGTNEPMRLFLVVVIACFKIKKIGKNRHQYAPEISEINVSAGYPISMFYNKYSGCN